MSNDEELRRYLEQSAKQPLLSRQEEMELFAQRDNGDLSAQEDLIASNMRLVVSIARKYQGDRCHF